MGSHSNLFKPFGRLEEISAKAPWAFFPRKKLDVEYSDLAFGLYSCITTSDNQRDVLKRNIENLWGESSFVCLSVRTGFDLYLQTLNLPFGSEIICSSITIPDMITIIRHHGLIPIPVDLDKNTCSVQRSLLINAIGNKSKAILIAHIFGTRNSIDPLIEVAEKHKLLVIEDCAQSYGGNDYRGHIKADISMFSFGTIKTSTAFGGALLRIKDKNILERMKRLDESYLIRPRQQFFIRLIKYFLLHGLSNPAVYGLLIYVTKIFKLNHDEIITAALRGFSGGNLISLIRQRPSVPLLALLWRRLSTFNGQYLELRKKKCEDLVFMLQSLPGVEIPGKLAEEHIFWLFPVLVPDPISTCRYMLNDGFDVTSGSTQLTFVEGDAVTPMISKSIITKLVYLPVTPEMSLSTMKKMVKSLEKSILNSRI